MSEQWAWKRLSTGDIVQLRGGQPTLEELFAGSSFRLPVRDVSSAGYAPVKVILKDGKWIENTESEADRIWRAVVASSSR